MELKDLTYQLEYDLWKQRRRNTTIICYVLFFMYGLEQQSIMVSIIYYLAENFNMNVDKASFYFGAIECVMSVGQIFGGLFVGRYTDRTRNLRIVVLVNTILIVCGNLMYSLPYHLAIIFVGRLLCGMNESLQTAFCGEFRRCYSDADLIRTLGRCEICYAIGINIGPGLPVLFSYFEVHLGNWTINKYNSTNLLIVLCSSCVFIFAFFYATNLSKELDELKSQFPVEKEKELVEEEKKVDNKNAESDQLVKWRHLLQIDILVLGLTYGVAIFTVNNGVKVVSMFAASIFKWPISYLSWCHIGTGSLSYLVMLVLVERGIFNGKTRMFYFYMISSTFTMMVLISLMLPRVVTIQGNTKEIILVVFILALKCLIVFNSQTSGRFLMLNQVNHTSASSVDGFRGFMGSTFRIFSTLTVYLYFIHPEYFGPVIVLCQFSFILIMLKRRKNYM